MQEDPSMWRKFNKQIKLENNNRSNQFAETVRKQQMEISV
jgi:hypothetical protein